MLQAGGGVIVITASVQSIVAVAHDAPYQAAKGGLLALTLSLAMDYGPAIRVNALLPRPILTGAWDEVSEEEREHVAHDTILKRMGKPEEVAEVALFLASDASSYMTGSAVVVDLKHPTGEKPTSGWGIRPNDPGAELTSRSNACSNSRKTDRSDSLGAANGSLVHCPFGSGELCHHSSKD